MKAGGIALNRQVKIVNSLLSNDYIFPICLRIKEKLITERLSEDLVNTAIAEVAGFIRETNQHLTALFPVLKPLVIDYGIGEKRKKNTLAYAGLFSRDVVVSSNPIKHSMIRGVI